MCTKIFSTRQKLWEKTFIVLVSGYNDNGSGMAALLEVARALKHAECKNSYTFILVALDMEETGTQGAEAFVQDFLVKSILKPTNFPEFQVHK